MIHLDISETVATPYVVATAEPMSDPVAAARARVRHPLAADLLDTSLVQIYTFPASESGYAELIGSAAWVRSEDRGLQHKLTHHVIVLGKIPPVSQPGHGQALRAVARAVAEACEGIVYDAWSHQVLPHDFRFGAEHPEFCMADGWLAVFMPGPPAPDRDLHLITAGMHRFALPELEARKVPAANVLAAATLLRCLSVTLASEHWDWLACNPGARSRRLHRHVWAESRDVWRYWAADPKTSVPGRVRVRLTRTKEDGPDSLPYLSVGPPEDFTGPQNEWWNDVVDLAMPFVADAPRRLAA